ncbi:efflux RND transporter periplasmic adaptor subunit [Glaciimonas soli]|uniref:Efflux RND transporter periplasmic adaptor subunit n=1 Tax=Glaciimonas soli TaxID=2590999 RepID=A0A843YQ05_9BURK|nr:efflux RND transporter periplasmic adaptor subunit [Glaciimonas soli]MQQ99843.1 efflux RND transporter periplasmic adaptor subunit [Glaciimonas soli]
MKTSSPLLSKKNVVIAIGVLIVLAAGGLTLNSRAAKSPAASAPPPASVSVAKALEKSVTEWDDFSGRVEAIERVEIRPRVAGTIDAVHFQEGQLVKKGSLLFTIDPRPYQAELARASATQAGAQASLALAKTELDRSRRLIDEHAIAQSELDQRNNAVLEADANLKAAQAAVQTAKLNLEYTSITAPVSGRVSRAEITVGNLVGAGANTPALTTVVSVSPVYVNFEVDEQTYIRYAANGAAGNSGISRLPVSIGLANEQGYPHQGRIKSFDNRLDTASGTMRVRAEFDNDNGLLTPGMFARVRTGGSAAETVVLIDDKAVGTDQDKKYVMVVNSDNKVNYRPVALGPMVDGMRIVRSGLNKDERIVVNGLQRIRPNDVVTPVMISMDTSVALGKPSATVAMK